MIQFDLEGQLPENAVLTSVSVVLTVTGTPQGGGVSSTFGLHRVLKEWGEGDKTGNTGSPAGNGELTWEARINPSSRWFAPGGAGSVDYFESASALASIGNVGEVTFGPSDGLLRDIEQWRGNAGANFGWILISQAEDTQGTARRFGSRESGNSEAAALVIEFTVPFVAEPPTITVQPASQTVTVGATVVFEVGVSGTEPFNYQWRFNGVDISGAAGRTLSVSGVDAGAAGGYSVVVTNVAGSVTSSEAVLVVESTPIEPPRIEKIELSAEWVTLTFSVPPHVGMAVEFNESLGNGAWTMVETIAASPVSVVVRATDVISGANRRFYRLRMIE